MKVKPAPDTKGILLTQGESVLPLQEEESTPPPLLIKYQNALKEKKKRIKCLSKLRAATKYS